MKILSYRYWVNLTIFICLLFSYQLKSQDSPSTSSISKESALEGATASQVELIRRQEAAIFAQRLIRDAQNAQDLGDYTEALRLYEEAEKRVSDAPAISAERQAIFRGKSICLFQLARVAFENKDYEKAQILAAQAYESDPDNRDALTLEERAAASKQVVEEKKQKETQAAAEVPKEVSNADFVKKQKRALDSFHAAENYFKSEQFDQAEAALKEVLRVDPYSATAYHRLREVQLAKYKKLNSAKQQAETESMLDVQNGWRLPLRRDKGILIEGMDEGSDLGMLGGKKKIIDKLNSIIIKKLEFVETPVEKAIDFLITESREADPSPGKEGVNIIMGFKKTGGDEGETAPKTIPPVSLNLKNVTLLNAIKYLTQTTGLSYHLEPDAVTIDTQATVYGRIDTRQFNIEPGIFRSVIEREQTSTGGQGGAGNQGGGAGGGGGGGAGGFKAIGGVNVKTKSADVRKAFEEFGIDFSPKGTNIAYNESLGILLVSHTTDVLDRIESILLKLNKTPAQVQIEAKFIDVKQTDLNELGFRWAFAHRTNRSFGNPLTLESGEGTPLFALPPGGTGAYTGQGNQFLESSAGSRGFRDASDVSVSALDALLAGAASSSLISTGADTLLTLTGVLTDPMFQVIVNALAQKGMANLLSAPRVTTTSGDSAKILITREFIFPSAYSDPQISTGTGGAGGASSAAVVGPSPTAFSTREVGVILDVKPQVGPDNYTISLSLSPEVIDFEGFINYSIFAALNSSSFTFNIAQPIFNKRSLTTNVTIWDGQTVLLGGLIREDVSKIDDKIPFLGDLPLIGRLFRSKVENTVKRNLMVFLTARIVDPAGNPIHKLDTVSSGAPSASSLETP